jgi:hypothetical protein
MSAAVKLGAFLLLLAVVFGGAYAAGARVGPIAPGPGHGSTPAPPRPAGGGSGGGSGGGGGGGMHMGWMP